MSAMRPEPVEVQLNDGRPGRFVWRGRLYTVLAVIQRPGEERATRLEDFGSDDPEAGDASPSDPPAEHEHRLGRWRCWRVTAAPGRNVPAIGFRLCYDEAGDRWLLTRESV